MLNARSLWVETNASVGIESATSRNVIERAVAHVNFIVGIVASNVVSVGVCSLRGKSYVNPSDDILYCSEEQRKCLVRARPAPGHQLTARDP